MTAGTLQRKLRIRSRIPAQEPACFLLAAVLGEV